MLQKLSECQNNVLLGRLGAQRALDDFKTQQMEIVSSIREVVSSYHDGVTLRAQYSLSERERAGATTFLKGVIMITRLTLISGSRRQSFIVFEKNRALTFTPSASSPSSSNWDTSPVMLQLFVGKESLDNPLYLVIQVSAS
jgi:hypothetical protein